MQNHCDIYINWIFLCYCTEDHVQSKQFLQVQLQRNTYNLLIAAISNDVFFHFPNVLCLNCEDDEIMQMWYIMLLNSLWAVLSSLPAVTPRKYFSFPRAFCSLPYPLNRKAMQGSFGGHGRSRPLTGHSACPFRRVTDLWATTVEVLGLFFSQRLLSADCIHKWLL